MSSDKKIIAVMGATGTQGGGVLRSLLEDGTFAVRAVTRNPDSASSKELKSLGAEVVQADLDNTPSLTEAFKGCYGVYGVTDFWALFALHNYDQAATAAHETQHGRNLVDAAKAAGVQYFVWSTLDHGDTINCFHFRSKYEVNDYVKASGIPYTLLYTAFYYSNLTTYNMLKPEEDGTLTLTVPLPSETKFHTFDGSDAGRWVVPILKDTERYNGKDVHAVAEFINTYEMAEIITRVSGKKCNFPEISKDTFYSEPYKQKVGNELWLNSQLWVEGKITRDLDSAKAVGPNAVTLEIFLTTNPQARKLLGRE